MTVKLQQVTGPMRLEERYAEQISPGRWIAVCGEGFAQAYGVAFSRAVPGGKADAQILADRMAITRVKRRLCRAAGLDEDFLSHDED